eukprot:3272498-Pyramimonas_sp.AAC.1
MVPVRRRAVPCRTRCPGGYPCGAVSSPLPAGCRAVKCQKPASLARLRGARPAGRAAGLRADAHACGAVRCAGSVWQDVAL